MTDERVRMSARAGMAEDVRLRMASEARLLCAVRGFVRGYFGSLGFSGDKIDSVILAIDEACANSIRHAYQGKPTGIIELAFRVERDFVEVVVRDFGKPARPADVQAKRAEVFSRDSLPRGGFGVQFIRQVFDSVEFSTGKRRGNRVQMRLKRPRKAVPCPGTRGKGAGSL